MSNAGSECRDCFQATVAWRRMAQKTNELSFTEIEVIQEEQEMKSWLMQEELALFWVVFRIVTDLWWVIATRKQI